MKSSYKMLRSKLEMSMEEFGKLFSVKKQIVYEKESGYRIVSKTDKLIMSYIMFLHNKNLLDDFMNEMNIEKEDRLFGDESDERAISPKVLKKFDELYKLIHEAYPRDISEYQDHLKDFEYMIVRRESHADKKQLIKLNDIWRKFNQKVNKRIIKK